MNVDYVLENRLCECVFIGIGCKPTSSLDNALKFQTESSADWFRINYVKDGYKYKVTSITSDTYYKYTAEKDLTQVKSKTKIFTRSNY